jgi:rubrerythrin
MDKKTQERIEALEIALNNEKREKEFYLKNAERTGNSLGKLMFRTIASEEDEHYQRIFELKEKLQNDGQWPATLPLKIKDTEIKSVLKKFVDSVDTSQKADAGDMEAVKIAIDFETAGEAFYNRLRDGAGTPQEKAFFDMLAKMENEHRLSLQDTYEYFQDPEGWFRIKEGHHLDGA